MGGDSIWQRIGDRFLYGVTDDQKIDTLGGENTVTLTVDQIPTHHHEIVCAVAIPFSAVNNESKFNWFFNPNDKNCDGLVASDNISVNGTDDNSFLVPDSFKKNSIVGRTGSGQSHNNMPQYIGCVVWKRTA